jgi:hypothetical protein
VSRVTCIMGKAITDNLRMSPDQLRRVIDAADERALPEELADIAQAYELITHYEQAVAVGADYPDSDYRFLARHALTLEDIGTRETITRHRTITAQSESHPRVTYSLRRIDVARWTCTCPGWQHRGHCKHSDAATGKVAPVKVRKLRGSLRADHERDLAGGSLALVAASLEAAR